MGGMAGRLEKKVIHTERKSEGGGGQEDENSHDCIYNHTIATICNQRLMWTQDTHIFVQKFFI